MDLKQALDSLRLENGMPDVLARRNALENLLQNISSSEIRYLKKRLPDFKMAKDFGTLPTELLIYIVDYLDLEDFLRIRAVSHGWQKAFSVPEICSRITKAYFQPYWNDLDPDHRNYISADWATQAAIKRLQRLNRRHNYDRRVFCSKSFSGGPTSGPLPTIKRPQYYHGKIAWNYDERTIAIKDIETEVEVLHREENREMLSKWLLSDQYLIVTKASLNQILAIPLNGGSSTQTFTIHLPSVVKLVFASHQQVGIVTISNEIFFWRVGGTLRQFHTSPLLADIAGNLEQVISREHQIFFHPQIESRFYLVTIFICRADQGTFLAPVQIVLQEYENSTVTTTHRIELVADISVIGTYFKTWRLEDGNIGFQILGSKSRLLSDIDPRRGSITSPEKRSTSRIPTCAHLLPDGTVKPLHRTNLPSQRALHPLIILKFDIHSRRWSTSTYHVSRRLLENADRDALLWRDQLLFARHVQFSSTGTTGTVIEMEKSCDLPPTKCWPWLMTPDGRKTELIQKFEGDDQFIVGFGGNTYTVFAFEPIDPMITKE